MLQTFIWWRHANLLPVSTFHNVVVSTWPWCIFPYNLMQDVFIQSKVIDIFPKFKMAADAILDCQFMWIWPFQSVDSVVWCSVPNLVQIFCNSHWDRCTCASDLHLMTSRELTSGFDFWSRGHVCMSSMHLPVKFGADIFIQSGVVDIFLQN